MLTFLNIALVMVALGAAWRVSVFLAEEFVA
jgi:hypothetical protein